MLMRFIGTSGIVGNFKFTHGEVYRVVSSWNDPVRGCMFVEFSNGADHVKVPYSSRDAFDANWEVL